MTPAFGWGCGFKQVTVVERVLDGHVPQLVAMMLYLVAGQLDTTAFQLKISCLEVALISNTLVGGGRGTVMEITG